MSVALRFGTESPIASMPTGADPAQSPTWPSAMKFAAHAAKPAETKAPTSSICASRRLCLSARSARAASASASNKPPRKPSVGINAAKPTTMGGPPAWPLAVYKTSIEPDALAAPKPMVTSGCTPGNCSRATDSSMTSAAAPPASGRPLFKPTA